ncbi:unnamed protein product [Ostreobium quekettii]|uniref:Uncharacterized protein n=1 Tax=Ostreobium quekettii TaxID=121088 RepID=A0A8S1IUW9_9CHLO|nr:unnamed protein product [Ostreobium quekettii]|eukprot:evm.model.scf_2739.1 EVM.evm.TU.scf_2739.1   scf_2739:8495-11782(+)
MRRISCLVALCVALLAPTLCARPVRRISQVQFPPPDSPIVPLPSGLQIFPAELAAGEPKEAVLEFRRPLPIGFSVPRLGAEFPDLLFSLTVTNAGGEADMFCRPTSRPGDLDPVFGSDAVWSSNHSVGTDYVFISRNHTQFNEQVRAENTDQGITLFSDILCNVWSLSETPTSVVVELDVVPGVRSLVDREREAVGAIFEECCGDEGCPVWRAIGDELFGGDDEEEAPLDLCHVRGSVCDEEGHAVRINMAGWGLACEMPVEEFKKFPKLEKLDLSHNAVGGKVEDILGGLTSLRNLVEFRASDNDIDGFVDSLAVCRFARRNMTTLNLELNDIQGPLPGCLFDNTTTLKELHLGGNNLSSTLPDVFSVNSTLEAISLEGCGLTGNVPKSITNLTRLRTLFLQENNLTGRVNDNLFKSDFLRIVNLRGNNLTGKIPSSIAESPVVMTVLLDGNKFTKVPNQWMDGREAGLSTNLGLLGLSANNLKGDFPVVLGRLPNLGFLDIRFNQFSGPLPAETGLFPQATGILLSNNSFNGSIPEEWGTIGIVANTAVVFEDEPQFIDLRNNNLTGELPDFLLDAEGLAPVNVLLSGNNLTCPDSGDDGEPVSTAHLPGLEC